MEITYDPSLPSMDPGFDSQPTHNVFFFYIFFFGSAVLGSDSSPITKISLLFLSYPKKRDKSSFWRKGKFSVPLYLGAWSLRPRPLSVSSFQLPVVSRLDLLSHLFS